MKPTKIILWTQLILTLTFLAGCARHGDEVWDDTKTCGRYMGRGFRSLGGKGQNNSRLVSSPDEFGYVGDDSFSEFVPLSDSAGGNNFGMNDVSYPQAREMPGDPGSSVPGIEAFSDPSTNPRLAAIFRNIQFELDSSLVKGDSNLKIIHSVSDYLRGNPNTYVFIEGHCDERGPEAYNLALGSRRANTVRNMLIAEGANPDRLFTVSYGKERPLVLDPHEEGWAQNRRAEFKIYQR